MDLKNLVPGYRQYSMEWLVDEFENGTQLKYLYFWGHTSNSTDTIGKECFSQWYNSPFVVNEKLYKTAEHWMMAQKALLFDDLKAFQQIIQCEKPGEAKYFGRQVIGYDDSIWNKTKYDIVKLGNIHKFNQHESLVKFLLSTTNRVLVEASPVDKVWGAGISKDSDDLSNLYAWPGLNLLGFALMEVRDILLGLGNIKVTNHLLPPPWIQFPGINPNDMFWKMGKGEEHIISLGKQEEKMDEKTRFCYFLNNPAPYEWRDYYAD